MKKWIWQLVKRSSTMIGVDTKGFRAKVEQNVKADKRELVKGSNLGKNISFSTTAI